MSSMGTRFGAANREFELTGSSYVEGIVRGYRNNLLTSQNYGNLTQCETIDGKRKQKAIATFDISDLA